MNNSKFEIGDLKERFPMLTLDEVQHIEETSKCPDCKTGVLMEGPEAGLMINVKCADCGHKFNLCRGYLQLSHRLPDDEKEAA